VRIAQVAQFFEGVPREYYGGTERLVSYLTEELVCQIKSRQHNASEVSA
jgi:hypothetical protein